jgi:hypothetical protein
MMTAKSKYTSSISPRDAPEFCLEVLPSSSGGRSAPPRGSRECRTLGASADACALVESTRVSHHGHAGNVRHSPRNGFNGFLRALPGDRACLPPSSPRSLSLGNLTPASGRQDHTASPSARSAPSSTRSLRPPHPAPTSVTIAKRPSVWDGMARDMQVIWVGRESKYFCERGWTTPQISRRISCLNARMKRAASRANGCVHALQPHWFHRMAAWESDANQISQVQLFGVFKPQKE